MPRGARAIPVDGRDLLGTAELLVGEPIDRLAWRETAADASMCSCVPWEKELETSSSRLSSAIASSDRCEIASSRASLDASLAVW
jgi:hypothetical protein